MSVSLKTLDKRFDPLKSKIRKVASVSPSLTVRSPTPLYIAEVVRTPGMLSSWQQVTIVLSCEWNNTEWCTSDIGNRHHRHTATSEPAITASHTRTSCSRHENACEALSTVVRFVNLWRTENERTTATHCQLQYILQRSEY